jgi:hypothetical protein
MHSRLVAFIGLAGLLMAAPALADQGGCCADKAKADHACCDMPCCANHKDAGTPAEANAVDVFFQMEQPSAVAAAQATTLARQATVVWFNHPVRIGDSILQGRYVIEHDNDRMARGEPCTHIYAFNDQKNPVVAFHCTHLERETAKTGAVVLRSGSDGFKRLVEFQFRGDASGHGVPAIR